MSFQKSRKTYYAVLCERALELHDSEKTYRKGKSARYLIDLSIAFNLHNEHLDPKLKRCVCLMGPDETLCLKVDDAGKGGDEGRQNAEWYNAIMSALIPSRVLQCAWDVDVVNAPKVKRPGRCEEQLQNICLRLPEIAGQKRLCFYAHTIAVCKRRIEPATHGIPSSGIPPFHVDDFFEIPRKCVAFFGCQERFFLMRLGRGSPMGASELWAQWMKVFKRRVGSPASTSNGIIGRKPSGSSGPHPQQLGSRALSVSCGSQGQFGSKSHDTSLMSIFPSRDINTSVASKGDCGVYQQMGALSNLQTSTSTSTTDETENSGGTICIEHKEASQSEKMGTSQRLPEMTEGGTSEARVLSTVPL
uniref:PH domain-containing protein n=1 Tax=Angiostrongylus cantonensis TaxID=6313 RepID=A0A0K0CW24_ANGCA